MSTFKIEDIRSLARIYSGSLKTASSVLNEAVQKQSTSKEYDIFLSHAFHDAELILGVKVQLEGLGHSVYVDWVEDAGVDRSKVDSNNARLLRERMNHCKSLFYSTTDSSAQSKWMPWECGYVDGKYGKVAILPLTHTGYENYQGQEYLGIYPYVVVDTTRNSSEKVLWIMEASDIYCRFSDWLLGEKPRKRS